MKLNESSEERRKLKRNLSKMLNVAIYLSTVHEVQQARHVIAVNVGHEQNRMCRRMFNEDLLEVRTTHRQNLREEFESLVKALRAIS